MIWSWAVLFGKFEWESVEEIDELGHPTEKPLQYVKQLASYFQIVGFFFGFERGWTAELSKVDVEQFRTVLKRDREKSENTCCQRARRKSCAQ